MPSTKNAKLNVTLTGDWQKIGIPEYFVGYQIENRDGNDDVEVRYGESGDTVILEEGDIDEEKAMDIRYPIRQEIYLKGTEAEIVNVTVNLFDDQSLP